ncbi:MAG: sugar ABC transporter substrate-binding protein [Candidatus Bathyarchaeota archaeon]
MKREIVGQGAAVVVVVAIVAAIVGGAIVYLLTPVEVEEEAKLTFLRAGGAAEEEVVGAQVQEIAEEMGIEVDFIMVPWGQALDKLMTMVGGGDAPDIAYVGSRWIPKFAASGIIAPIDIPGDRKAEYYESIWPMVTWNGEIYGVPRAFSTKALYYNTELFQQVGIEGPPETWAELEAAAKKISEETDAAGYALAGQKGVSTTTQFFNFLFQNGGSVFDEDGNVTINNANGIETLKFYIGLAEYAEEGPTAWQREELWSLFADGKVGMYVSGPWRAAAFEDAGVPFKTALQPSGPNGSSSTTLVSDSLIVLSQSEHLDMAQEFVLKLTNEEYQTGLDTEWGLTPMRKGEKDLDFFQTDTWKTFIAMVSVGKPQPLVKDWEILEDAVTDGIQFALLGQMTPEEALDWVALRLEGLK